jgi:hypothetical protein
MKRGLVTLLFHIFFSINEELSNIFLRLALILTKDFRTIHYLGLVAIKSLRDLTSYQGFTSSWRPI